MKTIILTLLLALSAHADSGFFITNEHHKDYEVVQNLRSNGNSLAAIKKLKVLYSIDPQNEENILAELSKLYNDNQLNERFVAFLQEQIKKAPFSANLNYQLAKEYLVLNKPNEACEKVKFILSHAPKRVEFYSILADCAVATNQLAEALRYLDLQITPQSASHLYLKRAQLHLKLNNLTQAKSDLDIYFLKSKPTEQAYLVQIELFTKQQYAEKVPGVYRACLNEIGASEKCFLGYLSSTRDLNTNFKLEHFNQHLTTYKQNTEILLEIGFYYQQMKKYDMAEIMYQAAHKSQPGNIKPVSSLFHIYNEQNESQKAFDIVNKFFSHTKNTDNLHIAQNLQNSLFKKTLEKTTVKTATPSDKQPASVSNHSHRQMYLAKKHNELLVKLQKITPKTDADYFLMGNLYYHSGSYGNAKLHWSKIKPNSPLFYKATFNRITIMRVENMRTAAQKLFGSTEFPLSMYAQTQKLSVLMGEFSTRLPAEEKKKITEMLTALLYLEWES